MKCPNCGKSHYREMGGTSTCVMWYPEYKDGKQINKNPNTLTMNYECCECGAHFHTSNNGEPVLDVVPNLTKPAQYSVEINGEEILKTSPMSIPEFSAIEAAKGQYVTIDSDGVVHGMENAGCLPNLNRYRKCQICGKDFICGSAISDGIGPDTDKYICDECAESLKILIDLIPVIQENRDEIQVLKDKLREKSKKEVNFKE